MANLLDLMKPEDRERAVQRFKARTAERGIENKISSEIFLVSEFGYYYGWEAVKAVRNNEITLEEMNILLEGARKVWYRKLVEQSQMTTTSVATPLSKHSQKTYNDGMKHFIERSRING